jgi:2-polyprenyl-3-methyl-5-hydroxy-6-metoxy-1,4-benzoquinol methylase
MKCQVCSNDKENQTYEAQERMFRSGDNFRYFQCSECMCLQIEEFPPNMAKYYPDNYYSYNTLNRDNKIENFLLGLRNKYAVFGRGFIGKLISYKYPNQALESLKLLQIKNSTTILDVGCGSGTLLYRLRELGLTNLLGIDPFNEKDIQYKNGLIIEKRDIYNVEGKWDIVMFHHSFEHIHEPENVLRTVASLLAPEGHCIVRIPTSSSYAWNHYGVNWVQLDAPRHLFLHSVKSMNILSERAGLDLWKVVYDSTSYQFSGSETYAREEPPIFSKKEISAFSKRAKELNETKQGDQAVFYLRKL